MVVSFIFTSVVDQKPVLLQYLVPDTKDLSKYLPSSDFIVSMLPSKQERYRMLRWPFVIINKCPTVCSAELYSIEFCLAHLLPRFLSCFETNCFSSRGEMRALLSPRVDKEILVDSCRSFHVYRVTLAVSIECNTPAGRVGVAMQPPRLDSNSRL